MSNLKISNKEFIKLNEYFYMNDKGDILKYKKYCIIHSCKKLASFNHENKKEFLYCNEHKLDNMINIKKGYVLCKEHNISYSKDSFCKECEKLYCLLCNQNVNKSHYFQKKHIDILWGPTPFLPMGKMCLFPFSPWGKIGKKYMERDGNEYFFPYFSPWGKMGKDTFFPWAKMGLDPP